MLLPLKHRVFSHLSKRLVEASLGEPSNLILWGAAVFLASDFGKLCNGTLAHFFDLQHYTVRFPGE